MDWVTIGLDPYHQIVNLPRAFIRDALAGSLLEQALTEDPTAREITIPNPVVTPVTASVLWNLSNGLEPDDYWPELAPAGRYLNIPQLIVYSDPIYGQLKHPLRQAIQEDKPAVVEYIHQHYNVPYTQQDVKEAVEANAYHVIRLLLSQVPQTPASYAELFQLTEIPLMREILTTSFREFNNP